MDAEGQYFDWCHYKFDDGEVCGGPVLSTQDSSRCFKCGHETGLDMLPNRYISDGFGRDILVSAIGEAI